MDGLPPLVFKMFHNQLVMLTTALFNKLLEQESYPEMWSSDQSNPYQRKVTENALGAVAYLAWSSGSWSIPLSSGTTVKLVSQ